uniref:Cathepsin L-like n=1 Tax=Plectus sambesii TaxID=2011161 RepID=A0A914XJK6_9BILA
MKVFIVFCLTVGALAARSGRDRHQNAEVEQKAFRQQRLLLRVEETSESAEDAFDSDDKDRSNDSFGSSRLDGIPNFNENERDILREPNRLDHADWEAYKGMHGKFYINESEDNERFKAFLSAQQTIRQHNNAYARGETDFHLGLSHLSDLLPEEYRRLSDIFSPSDDSLTKDNQTTLLAPLNVNIPDHIDWRDYGYVTPVKSPGRYSVSWATSATGALEGQTKRKTGHLVPLSEQNLVDCSGPYGKGGNVEKAYQYIKDNRGIDTEQSYPDEGRQSQCRFRRQFVGATVSGYVKIPSGNERQLQVAVATVGPVSVKIDAGQRSFQLYRGGIYYDPKCNLYDTNHAVLVVGYGSENGKDYWIVKNCWGDKWGDRGYIRMARNRGNNCGIASYAIYPLV